MSAPPSAHPGPSAVAPRAGLALGLLLAINLFNYIDRQVLSAVLPKLELDATLFRPDDPYLKFKLGWLTTAFLVTYMLAAPVFGRLGDRRSRWALVGIGVILWSLASGGSGLATGFVVLLLTRCLVGIGEAAYGPVAPAMISDLYPEKSRGQALSWFYMAIPVGSALGFVVGGLVADTSWGWRGAFQVVVLPGILLGVVCFFMKEPPPTPPAPKPARPLDPEREDYREFEQQRVATAGSPVPAPLPVPTNWMDTLRILKGIRSFVLCSAGMTCTTFVLGGVAAWAPYYIFERQARFEITPNALDKLSDEKASDGTPLVPPGVVGKLRPLQAETSLSSQELKSTLAASSLTDDERSQYQSRIFDAVTAPDSTTLGSVGTIFGGIVVVSGLVATLFGGWLGDRLRGRVRGAYFLVSGYGALIAFPAFVAMLYVPFPYAWGFVFVAVFFLFINTGPANTILANVTSHAIRASAFAINILVIHALGDAISPPLIGLIADLSSLGTALLLVSFLILLGGGLWVWGARYLDEDTRRVTEAETPATPIR
jgi:MFS transporter, Spinster family, sphingosine-1-phosphate transporter